MFDEDVLRVSLPLEGTYDLEIRTLVQSSTVALEYKPRVITPNMAERLVTRSNNQEIMISNVDLYTSFPI